jgi:hypothetical protein
MLDADSAEKQSTTSHSMSALTNIGKIFVFWRFLIYCISRGEGEETV